MRNVGALVVLGLLVLGGLYANLWWDAAALAENFEAQSVKQLLAPQTHRDAETIAQALQRSGDTRGVELQGITVHVGEPTPVKLGSIEYRPNAVEFAFTARRPGILGVLLHRRVKGTARVQVNQGPRDWPPVP